MRTCYRSGVVERRSGSSRLIVVVDVGPVFIAESYLVPKRYLSFFLYMPISTVSRAEIKILSISKLPLVDVANLPYDMLV